MSVRRIIAVSLLLVSPVLASRQEPADVKPVTVDGIEYRAPREHMGFVEAHNRSGALLWSRQIFVVVKNPDLESDVQDVYITSLKPDGGELIVDNERGAEFRLALATLEVKVVKGSLRTR